ncbi:hypothetical protein [Neobacillus ginsengisoli]|uniref:Uncharacterized protein n=1 Tax=Neobacillus ginsengisoli TaxID=904295 RepID=A0ABT9XWQ5_9BACI|nr:hypothetical protein [Neobacillus ginsengisoli]MDQ0199997.1 hypothetical protein [Neobacillus ginsengisoli]
MDRTEYRQIAYNLIEKEVEVITLRGTFRVILLSAKSNLSLWLLELEAD